MNKRKVVGYTLIVIPIVTGLTAATIYLGVAFLQGVGIGLAFILPILGGLYLLSKS